ncbi:MAG: hypothetical protein PWQ13_281 [Bacillota bacterium]|nr:hypothetical protein [Bacillota bacterium]
MSICFRQGITPEGYALGLLHELGIPPVPPIQPFAICEKLGIKVAWEPLDSADALIVKAGRNAYIILRAGQAYQSREMFTVSHELGHYYIPHHLSNRYVCNSRDILSFQTSSEQEQEANRFAAELLMPGPWLKQKLVRSEASLEFIRSISFECGTSLTSTAFRIADICPDRIAVVYTENGFIKWFKKSRTFPYFVRKGKVDPRSYVADFFSAGTCLALENPKEVLASAWVTDANPDKTLIEESAPMPNLNAVLTVLTVPFSEDDEEWDDDMYWV